MWDHAMSLGSHGISVFIGVVWVFLGALLVALVWALASRGGPLLSSTGRALRAVRKRNANSNKGRDESARNNPHPSGSGTDHPDGRRRR